MTSHFRSSIQRAAILIFAAAVSGSCGTDGACACSPPETIVGTYHATRLRFTPNAQSTVDALTAGSTLNLTLSSNGTTSGTLFVPASLNNGVQATYDLAGTYQSGTYITFSQSADTFIRDVNWTWQGHTLVTTGTAGGVQYDVVLTRQ